MWAYLIKRFFLIFVTLFGICMISFVLVTLAPGDPAATAAGVAAFGGKGGHAKDEVLEHTRKALYLDRPVLFNFSPNSRKSVAREFVKKLCEGSDYTRESARDEILGGIGTAGLDVFVAEATSRAQAGALASAHVKDVLDRLDLVANNPAATGAEVDAMVRPVEAAFPGRSLVVRQGEDMGRTSVLECQVLGLADANEGVRVGGGVVVVGEGRMFLEG